MSDQVFMSEQSVTRWIAGLKAGDEIAAAAIWERFFFRLRDYARGKLGPTARRAVDEEDLALSAIYALCIGAQDGRFPQLANRNDIWQILVMIAARKASNARRRGHVRREVSESDAEIHADLMGVTELANENSAELFDSLNIHCEELLARLDDRLRHVALLKLSGYTNEEIAGLRNRGLSTIERYLQLIRSIWSESVEEEAGT